MDLVNIILFFTAGSNSAFAFFIFLKNPKNKINVSFSLMLILISIWIIEMTFFRASSELNTLKFWLTSYYVTAALIPLAFSYFCSYFPFEIQAVKISLNVFNFVLASMLLLAILILGVVFSISYSPDLNHSVTLNIPIYIAYIFYFIGYVVFGFTMLFRKLSRSSSYQRKTITIVFFATFIAAIAGIVFDLIIPFVTYRYIWLGPCFTAVMVFIIVRYVFIKQSE